MIDLIDTGLGFGEYESQATASAVDPNHGASTDLSVAGTVADRDDSGFAGDNDEDDPNRFMVSETDVIFRDGF